MAEEAYTKAFDLSEQKRLDIEVKRLNAKVNRMNEDPEWDSEVPEDLEEADFQFLLHLQKGKEKTRDRIYTLNSYGICFHSCIIFHLLLPFPLRTPPRWYYHRVSMQVLYLWHGKNVRTNHLYESMLQAYLVPILLLQKAQ